MELSTVGTMEHTQDGYRLIYQESETTGMEGVTTYMMVNPEAITLERRGRMNSLMVLEKGRRTICNYDTGYGSLMMGLYTSEIQTEMDNDGGEFYFHYTLDINSGMASSHDVHVSVKKRQGNEAQFEREQGAARAKLKKQRSARRETDLH